MHEDPGVPLPAPAQAPEPPPGFDARDLRSLYLLSQHPDLQLPALLALPPSPEKPFDLSPSFFLDLRPSTLPPLAPDLSLLANLNLITSSESDDAPGPLRTPGSRPDVKAPTVEEMIRAFNVTHGEKLTVGGRALTKHAHRDERFWGPTGGSSEKKNEHASLALWKIVLETAWENVFELPGHLIAYERRTSMGHGVRWTRPEEWVFRGFIEPPSPDGHERRWRT